MGPAAVIDRGKDGENETLYRQAAGTVFIRESSFIKCWEKAGTRSACCGSKAIHVIIKLLTILLVRAAPGKQGVVSA